MPNFPITDAHVHLWDPQNLSYPWLEDDPLLNRVHDVADYDKSRGEIEVDAMVFVECDEASGRGIDEARWVGRLAEREPRLQGIVARAKLELGEACLPDLEALAAMPLVRGVRRILQAESDPGFCLQTSFIVGLQLLPRFDFSFDICITHGQLANVIEMVRQCPEVRFVLDHLAKPDIKNGVLEPWKAEMKTLAGFPNVMCKISGLVTEADRENWTADDLAPYVHHAIECFGSDRVLFGGDWPVIRHAAEVDAWIAALDLILSDASADELRKLYRDNARRTYKLGA